MGSVVLAKGSPRSREGVRGARQRLPGDELPARAPLNPDRDDFNTQLADWLEYQSQRPDPLRS